MKACKKILVFVAALVLIFSAIAVPGIAADDIQDFIGKHEQQRIEEELGNAKQPADNEQPTPRPVYSVQSYSSSAHWDGYIAGERLETNFDLAPALRGGSTTPRLRTVQTTQPTGEEQYEQIEPITQEIEPISDFVPPPNTGRDSYFIWWAFGLAALSGGTLLALRKKTARS